MSYMLFWSPITALFVFLVSKLRYLRSVPRLQMVLFWCLVYKMHTFITFIILKTDERTQYAKQQTDWIVFKTRFKYASVEQFKGQ